MATQQPTINAALAADPCLSCIPDGMQNQVIIQLLNQLTGLNQTAQQLMDAAKCYGCITPATGQDIINYLFGLISGGGGGSSRGDGTLGLFSYGNSGATGAIVINDTTVVPGYDIESEPNITSVSFPNLVSVDPSNLQSGYFTLNLNAALASVSLPLLQSVAGTFECSQQPSLTNLSLPNLVTVGAFVCQTDIALVSISVPKYVPTDGSTIDCSQCALNATSVELILRRSVLAGVTTCTINLSGGTNAGLASLSVQGQTDYAALVTAGNTITLNP